MHIPLQQKRIWALAVLFSSLSTIFWLQIGLNVIMDSRNEHANLLKIYAIEQRRAISHYGQHSAASDGAEEQNVDVPVDRNLRSPLNDWELRRAFGLSIPSLALRAPVLLPSRTHWDARNWELLEEQMQAGMLLGTVAYPHSSRPGAGGALYIAGHSSPPSQEARESAYGTIFRSLPDIYPGAEIIITDGDERFTYVVTEKFIVNAEDTGILDSVHAEGTLTLITCYPVGTTRQRFVVKAERRD